MKTALIISGGDYSPPVFSIEYDYVIACDKGYEYARNLNISPDIVIGDFDSIDKDIVFTSKNDASVITYPVEKDDTDTMLAIKHALDKGYKNIIIICALGGRTDHLIANIQSMHYASLHGASCEIYSETEYLRTVSGPATTYINPSLSDNVFTKYFSLFSLTDECTGITITDAKYEVVDITLKNSFPLGHGNSFISNKKSAKIKIDSGTLIIIQTISQP